MQGNIREYKGIQGNIKENKRNIREYDGIQTKSGNARQC